MSRPERDSRQAATTARYDRSARFYDLYDLPMDVLGGVRSRRRRLLRRARGRVLEVGIGTGRNLDLYPPGVAITGIDVSDAMLAQARERARELALEQSVELISADVHDLPFPDASFDTVVATCVFCSVADPVAGLDEMARVTDPAGRALLLEHVRPRTPVLGWLADRVNPVARDALGFNINRDTETAVAHSALDVEHVRRWGVWREIVTRPC